MLKDYPRTGREAMRNRQSHDAQTRAGGGAKLNALKSSPLLFL